MARSVIKKTAVFVEQQQVASKTVQANSSVEFIVYYNGNAANAYPINVAFYLTGKNYVNLKRCNNGIVIFDYVNMADDTITVSPTVNWLVNM